MATKKMQSYRLGEETIGVIRYLSERYRCSQAEVIESALEIISNAALLDQLDQAARETYELRHGIDGADPTMRDLVRESCRL